MEIPFGLSRVRACIYVACALAFIAVSTFAGCEHHDATAARTALSLEHAQLASATDANASQDDTIKALQRALAEWRSLSVTPAEAAAAVSQVDEVKKLGEQLSAEIAKLKEKDRAKPDCDAWLRSDFERACPDLASGLRRAAADSDQIGAGRSAGASGAADRP